MTIDWNRRQALRFAGLAGAAAISQSGIFAAQQMPDLEPLIDDRVVFVSTTESKSWHKGVVYKSTFRWEMLNLNIAAEDLAQAARSPQRIEGFGACFNELGWTALRVLSPVDRETVMHELFDPSAGARFTYCRMPLGANDFSLEAYSYDETDLDFDLRHFSIDHDRATLIPFIHAAQEHQPSLRLWASPWTPPSWMKRNHFYAEAESRGGWKPNGIRPDQVGHEGEDLFILEPRFLDAYAYYFARFIQAYRDNGIHIGMVMPQNEFNPAQNSKLHLDAPGSHRLYSRPRSSDVEARSRNILRHPGERQFCPL